MPGATRSTFTNPTTVWGAAHLLNPDGATALTASLGLSAWAAGLVGDADAEARRANLGFGSAAGNLAIAGELNLGPYNVKHYGAVGDGVADDTAAINLAIGAAVTAGRGIVYLPSGVYKVTSTLAVASNAIFLVGAGARATRIQFEPTAADTCIEIHNGASMISYGGIRGIEIYAPNDSWAKIGIDLVDVDVYGLYDVVIHGATVHGGATFFGDTGSASVGLRVRGRAIITTELFRAYADIPIRIADNPNSTTDCDHVEFRDCSLAAYSNPCVIIDSGVNVYELKFTGSQAWNLGTYGLYWVDTTTAGVATGLTLENIRWEQGTDAAAYVVRIEHNTNLQRLMIRGCHGDSGRNGYYLRNVSNVLFDSSYYTGGVGRTALNADSTVTRITMQNMQWEQNATDSLTGHRCIWASPKVGSSSPYPPNAEYNVDTSTYRDVTIDASLGQEVLTAAASGGTVDLGTSSMWGLLLICDNYGRTAIFDIRGTYAATSEIVDPQNMYSAVSGTPSSVNVYWDAGASRYRIENQFASERRFRVVLVGAYLSF
ncbi:MAG TPA: hypothetical protein ENO19_00345 [Halothiobacillaceae bacterium]|nr:hypothetical protein [Halothiobacillaceae bacterium]